VILPPEMLGGPGQTTLDGLTAGEIGHQIGRATVVGQPRRPAGRAD
jgi:hypothetical protein